MDDKVLISVTLLEGISERLGMCAELYRTTSYGDASKTKELQLNVNDLLVQTREPRTTNLNFWEAYQAMKRGEWVATKLNPMIDRYFIGEDDQIWSTEKRGTEHASFSSYEYDNTEWYIVPKGPRYKVGDRFERRNHIDIPLYYEIIAAQFNHENKAWYAIALYGPNKEFLHYMDMVDRQLDELKKLPS